MANAVIKYFGTIAIIIVIISVIAGVIGIATKCDHDIGTEYDFVPPNAYMYGSIRPYCQICGDKFRYQHIEGRLKDETYFELIAKYTDGNELVPGEYYTVTAIANYVYDSGDEISLKLEDDRFLIHLPVTFQEEFWEQVKSVEKGDEITFGGKFTAIHGFTDCELIDIQRNNE